MPFAVRVAGALNAALDLERMALRAHGQTVATMRHFGQLYQTRVKANASGRPGPRVITGDYRRSITLEMEGTSAVIYSDAPQAARLEMGFAGPDALGRVYNQPPFPHWEPAIGPTLDELHLALGNVVAL